MKTSFSVRSPANWYLVIVLCMACNSATATGGGDLIDFETLPGGAPTVDLQEIGTQ